MQRGITVLLAICISLMSCDNDTNTVENNVNGNYIGVFERNGRTSNVTLTLNNGSWVGESAIDKFPALCNGIYTTSSGAILFENVCPWTAQFDWTLILDDNWNYTLNNNTLILTKSNEDKYTLARQ